MGENNGWSTFKDTIVNVRRISNRILNIKLALKKDSANYYHA